ncbi:DUF2905 domain-containing protein [candidate division KSB1 bacterium]|nr:DUF2905 domain-containing protein [candidate division KSB1 bacterium]
MKKILIIGGIILILAGLYWQWLSKFPLGRLPVDILVNKQHLKIYFPLTTMLLLSVMLSLLFWLFRK